MKDEEAEMRAVEARTRGILTQAISVGDLRRYLKYSKVRVPGESHNERFTAE